jgi:hypothetical protein
VILLNNFKDIFFGSLFAFDLFHALPIGKLAAVAVVCLKVKGQVRILDLNRLPICKTHLPVFNDREEKWP